MNNIEDETVRLWVKPNPFLYALEATRIYFLITVFLFAVIQAVYARGLPLYIAIKIAVTCYFFGHFIFFMVTVLLACCVVLIVTDKRVLVRVSFIWTVDSVAIPIQDIEQIEVRSYGARYGSVYIDYSDASRSSLSPDFLHNEPLQMSKARSRRARLVLKPCGLPIWLSAPFTRPQLRGFYGFKQFDEFARLILDLQGRRVD
jgi:hypothetical protein